MSQWKNIKCIESAEGNVSKFVYTNDTAVAESVLYKYPDYKSRTVICCSTMSGCPVGCRFCGAGDYFVKSLSGEEIISQVKYSIDQTGVDPATMGRLQIMFMSMGEPLLNKNGLSEALKKLYFMYPNAALLISSIGPDVDYEWLMELSERIPTIGLQFSVHEATDERRDALIPFKKKLTLDGITKVGAEWNKRTGRKPYFNYCAGDENSSSGDAFKMRKLFDPTIWNATISVICERNEGLPARNEHQRELACDFSSKLLELGFDVRVFDPAGQDDTGSGCGQLWFVQRWMVDNPEKSKPSIGHGMDKIHVPTLEVAS